MTSEDKLQQYLWDPSAEAVPEVDALERSLAELRFDPAAKPLEIPAARVLRTSRWSKSRRPLVALAVAASLLVAAGMGLWTWRWSWPEGRAWTVRTQSAESSLEVGRGVSVPQGDRAIANIARIGTMRLAGGTSVELRATQGRRHRLRMSEGSMHIRVWAPPGSVVVETPAGEVIDFGCEFVLSVTGTTSAVTVLSGWVQLENGIGEFLVPAGASSEMTPSSGPTVPVYDDAVAGFREAVRRVEREESAGPWEAMLRMARVRDVYTLLLLADRHRAVAEPVLRRAAELSPPPGDVTIGRILRGDRDALWEWRESLPLPPPKGSWWRNWRDAFPFWAR
jgi:ferric-dicitrate binding protein FerR (iron transport regulator)